MSSGVQRNKSAQAALPLLCGRGNDGCYIFSDNDQPIHFLSKLDTTRDKPVNPNNQMSKTINQAFAWSNGGQYLAFCDGQNLSVFDAWTENFAVVFQTAKTRVSHIVFSPLNAILMTFEPLGSYNQNKDNINLFSLSEKKLVATFTQSSSLHWKPEFSADEKVCCKLSKDCVTFYEDKDFSSPKHKLSIPGLAAASMFHQAPYNVAIHISGGKKGNPSMVKLLRYPDLDQYACMSSKTFYKADSVQLDWNASGSGLLIHAMTDVDNSGKAYYGETTLYYVGTDGSSNMLELTKKGPIYDARWDPIVNEFCVIYGHMPSRATLFTSKCESVYDFGAGLRSACAFSPQGNLLALYGHGAVRSNVEIWDRKSFCLVSKITNFEDIIFFSWSPCGERFLLATLAPNLKVDNKFSVYSYKGEILYLTKSKPGVELLQFGWQKAGLDKFPARKLEYTPLSFQQVKVNEAQAKKYVPPHLRQKQGALDIVLDVDDLPENERAAALNVKHAGKKKNNSKQNGVAGLQGGDQGPVSPEQPSVTFRVSAATTNAGAGPSVNNPQGDGVEDKPKKSRIKTLEKRLKEINQLKEKQKKGDELGKDVINKINREKEIRKELESLKLS